jgi:hypothetical protein
MSPVLARLLHSMALDGVALAWSVLGGPPEVGAFADARREQIADPSRNLETKLCVADFEARHAEEHPEIWMLIQASLHPEAEEAARLVMEHSIEAISGHAHVEQGPQAAARAKDAAVEWWRDRRADLRRKWKRSPAYGLD